jgi:beta-glucanase (GH16 family)
MKKIVAILLAGLLPFTPYVMAEHQRPAPDPVEGTTPPPQAVAAGFRRLSFDEECKGPLDIGYGSRGHKWNAGLWYEPIPPSSDFEVKNGVLTITATATSGVNLCTQYHDFSGGTYFQGGYFEARMRCSDWSAFWLYCADRPTVNGNLVLPSNPRTWTNEIDVIETDPGKARTNTVFCTVHKNTSSDGGVPDVQNHPDYFTISNGPVEGVWHTYGVLWTQTEVTWYVDNVKIASVPPYASTWQPVQLILGVGPGGCNGGASTVLPPTTQVQWVRVWEK